MVSREVVSPPFETKKGGYPMGSQNKKPLIMIGISIFLLFYTMLIPLFITANAQTGAGFSVRANIPENQIDKHVNYFDLRMHPEQIQELSVEVTNESDAPISVLVKAISASTSQNGIIDYTTPDVQDKTLQLPFSSIATVEKSTLVIPAKTTETARITITMPDEVFDGVVLGGLLFTRELEENTESQGTSINNQFRYIIGVKLSETDTTILPQFEIVEVVPENVNYRPAITHRIRNTQAAIVKNMDIEISILDHKNNLYATANMHGADMAPNSVLPFAVNPDGGKLKPGNYLSNIHLVHEGEVFDFQVEFTVDAEEAVIINSNSITKTPSNAILYFLLVIIVILVISVIILLRKRVQTYKS